MRCWMSTSVFQGKLKKAYKTCAKLTFWGCEIWNVKISVWREAQQSLQNLCETHNSRFGTCSANPPRGNKNTQASPMSPGGLQGASWGFIWAIWEPSGSLVGASRHLMGAIWEPSGGLVGAIRGCMGAFKHLKNMFRENNTSTPLTFTIQQEDIILQPGLAECAKPLK